MARRIQIILVVFFVLAGLRVFFIYRERNASAPQPKAATANPNFNADSYVVPSQVHAYDLKSAKQALDGKSVWVKSGYQVYYYPYGSGHVDFKHPAGLLPPLEKLAISNLIEASDPTVKAQEIAPGVRVRQEQVLAIFHRESERNTYAVSIGTKRGGDYTLYINETFYIDDPHQLYKHWPEDIWTAIEQHQVKPGMNELQASFAVGIGVPVGNSGDYGNRTLDFENNGHPLKVTFQNNRVTNIEPSSS